MPEDVRDYLRAAQQAEVQGDKRRAVELLEKVAKLYTAAGNPTRALSVLRHARRLDEGKAPEQPDSAASGLEWAPERSLTEALQDDADADTDTRRDDDPQLLPGNMDKKLIERGPQRAAAGLQAWCSFCCRPRSEVGDLVAGAAGVFVCAPCTAEAAQLLKKGNADDRITARTPMPTRPVRAVPPGQRETRGTPRAPAIPREAVQVAPRAMESTPFATDLDASTDLDTATRVERFTEEEADSVAVFSRSVPLADSADPAPAGILPRPAPRALAPRALAGADRFASHVLTAGSAPEPSEAVDRETVGAHSETVDRETVGEHSKSADVEASERLGALSSETESDANVSAFERGAHAEPRSLPPEPETLVAMTAAVLMTADPAPPSAEGLELVGQDSALALVEHGLRINARGMAIFGPAGTGKTTYLMALARAGKGHYVLASDLRSVPSANLRLLVDGFEALTLEQAQRMPSVLGSRPFLLAIRARPLPAGLVFGRDDLDLPVHTSQALIDATAGRLPQALAQSLSVVAQFETPDLVQVARKLVQARSGDLTLSEDSFVALASEAARSPVCGHELLALVNRLPPGDWTLKSAPAPRKKRTRKTNET